MKRIAMILALGTLVALPAALFAQKDHGEVGVYADYFRFSPGDSATNYVGVGGRVGFNVSPIVALEAEMNYDFARNYTSTYSTGTSAGGSTTFVTSSVRPLTGLFGPKFETPGPFKAFVTGKVGFVDFSVNNSGTVTSRRRHQCGCRRRRFRHPPRSLSGRRHRGFLWPHRPARRGGRRDLPQQRHL